MKTFATACLFGVIVTTSAAAQTAPGGAPESPAPDAKVERQRNNAAKLAGLLEFVKNACPDLRPDYDRFKSVAAGLGVTPADLSAGDLQLRARAYTETYTKDIPANCSRADANFGAAGTTIPGLVVKRAAP